MNSRWAATFVLTWILAGFSARSQIVINEIYYHPPDGFDGLEYIELFNPSAQPIDISGWKFTKGIKLEFPPNTALKAGGYAVVARDSSRLQQVFKVKALAQFSQGLKNSGETIELVNAQGALVDQVRFRNQPPWPVSPDGFSPALERIHPQSPSSIPQNWAAAPLPPQSRHPTGTPGARNSRYSPNLPPIISNVRISPSSPTPQQPITVEADVEDADGLRGVTLRYRLAGSGFEKEEVTLPMTKVTDTRFSGVIPAQNNNTLVRLRLEAADNQGNSRLHPDPHDLRPALSTFVFAPPDKASIPLAFILNPDPSALQTTRNQFGRPGRPQVDETEQMRWMAWQQLRLGLDLSPAWTQLALRQNVNLAALAKIQPLFTARETAIEELIDATVRSAQIRDQIPQIPRLVARVQTEFRDSLKSVLAEPDFNQFTAWQNQQSPQRPRAGRPPAMTADRVLRQMLDAERFFFAATSHPDLSESQFTQLKTLFQNALNDRAKFTNAANAAMRGQGDWGKIHEDLQELGDALLQQVEPLLTASQQPRFHQIREIPRPSFPNQTAPSSSPIHGRSAFVYMDPRSQETTVFDFINVRPRNAGFKVQFHRDQRLNQMTGINLIFEYKDRFVLAEHLAYELYRRAGSPAPASDFVRLTLDGQPLGYHLLVEQPNRGFLERNKIRAGGHLYKLLWYGEDIVSKHEKKTQTETGHSDITALIADLERTSGEAQWQLIQNRFDVPQVINYFAVNMCLTHWDGFFNNYFTYHDTEGTGKWQIYPWDQDKTWGFHDGLRDDQIFWDMPLTFGMAGDAPPNMSRRGGGRRMQGFDTGSWWRPPGYFSGPLLANPDFRRLFLARMKEMLNEIYTPQVFFPIIDQAGAQLKDEVAIRAKTIGENPAQADQRLKTNLQLLKNHLVKRRDFLLKQPELRSIP